MERLIKPKTFNNGVTCEIKVNILPDNAGAELFLCLSGGPLEPILTAIGAPSLDLKSDANDFRQLAAILMLAPQVLERTQ